MGLALDRLHLSLVEDPGVVGRVLEGVQTGILEGRALTLAFGLFGARRVSSFEKVESLLLLQFLNIFVLLAQLRKLSLVF